MTRRVRRLPTVVSLACMTMLVLGPLVRGADVPRGAQWISADDAVLYAEITRPETLIDRVTSDRIEELLRAVPGLKDSLQDNPQLRELQQVARYLADELDTEPVEGVRTLVGGGIVAAVEGTDKPDRVYLFVTPRDASFLEKAHAKLVELARRDAEEKGEPDPVNEADYRGVHGYSVEKNEAHAIIDGTLVIASGSEAMKALIDRIQENNGADVSHRGGCDLEGPPRGRRRVDAAGWAMVNLKRLREIDPERYASDKLDRGPLFLFGPWIKATRTADWASAVPQLDRGSSVRRTGDGET